MVKQTGARAVILDSATALFSPRPPAESLRSHFFQLVHALREHRPHVGHPRRGARRLRSAHDDGRRGLRLRPDAHPAEHHRRRPPPALDRGQQVPPQRALQGRVPLHGHDPRPRGLPARREGDRRDAQVERYSSGVAGPRRDDARRLAAQLDHHRPRPDRQRQDDAGGAVSRAPARRAASASSITASRRRGRSCCATSARSACRWRRSSSPGT